MAAPFAAPSCSIEVYPFEGGPFVIDGGQIRAVSVTTSLRGGTPAEVTIRLAPGGPYGPESSPTWTEVVTPMSHVRVGMSRGDRAAVVFDGIALGTTEEQDWTTTPQGSMAQRMPTIQCADFNWFFRSFNWFALTFAGMTAGTAIGQDMGFVPAGVPALLDQGLLGNLNPADTARRWYEIVMAGPGGILGKTYVPYKNGSRIPFLNMIGTVWENYPEVFIPFGDYYMTAEQSWMDKFLGMLPFPWYEFFVATAPSGIYPLAPGASGTAASGSLFTMTSQPLALPAGPQLVARVNPIPTLQVTADASSLAATIGPLDMSRWNVLPVDSPDAGFYRSEIAFDANGARNFYMLNPTAYQMLFGQNNANNIPYYFSNLGMADTASAHRYGFRPEIGTFRWLFDPTGTGAQNGDVNIPQTAAALLGKLVSWHHPTPLMAKAAVTLPLMPDVYVGTRFRYRPFKEGLEWEFYVETVRHDFVFGGLSTTTLGLSRGLPTAIYADSSSGGLLQAIWTGNAQRLNGGYAVGLPQGSTPPLTPFGPPDSITTMMANMARIFVTPQPGTQ